MKKRLDWFKCFPKDFVSDEHVEVMTTAGVGAYFLLLCKAWESTPPATLPNDDRILSRLARMTPEEWEKVADDVKAAFSIDPKSGRLVQKRLRQEHTEASALSRKRAGVASNSKAKAKQKDDFASIHAPARNARLTSSYTSSSLSSLSEEEEGVKREEEKPAEPIEKKPPPKSSSFADALRELKDEWRAQGLHRSGRASQGYQSKSAARTIKDALSSHSLDELRESIAAYHRNLKDLQFAAMFSTFFGPEKRLYADFLDSCDEEHSRGTEKPVSAARDAKNAVFELVEEIGLLEDYSSGEIEELKRDFELRTTGTNGTSRLLVRLNGDAFAVYRDHRERFDAIDAAVFEPGEFKL